MQPIRLGIVGCGAVTENFHLPAIAGLTALKLHLLVDRDLSRAEQLASLAGGTAATDVAPYLNHIDAAIVAVPNHLHARIAIDLLQAGKHVLVEKPMAFSVADCELMSQAAETAKVVLAAGHVRRFYPASIFVKEILASGVLGRVERFEISEGRVFRWPVQTDALFRKDMAGGGVLMDIGIHVADLALWWFGDWARLAYFDDAEGGVEADCDLHLDMSSGATGAIHLSRLRDLGNRWIIEAEQGTLKLGPEFGTTVRLSLRRGAAALEGRAVSLASGAATSIIDAFRAQLADFARAIETRTQPLVSGAEAARAVGLIEYSYQHRKPVQWPWRALLEQHPAQGVTR